MTRTMTGGCQCGRIRYSALIENDDAYLCHCRMCQRATGGVSIAYKGLMQEDVSWSQAPDWYQSSPIARRAFCNHCGTPLVFAYLDSDKMDLTVGSFDDPSRFVPLTQFGVESRHDAWSNTADLPGMRCDEYDALVQKWADAGGKAPE